MSELQILITGTVNRPKIFLIKLLVTIARIMPSREVSKINGKYYE